MLTSVMLVTWCEPGHSQDSSRIVITVDEVSLEAGEVSLLVEDSLIGVTPNPTAKQAAATVLIRRTLAMKSLSSSGGKALDAIIDRELKAFEKDAHDRGNSLAAIALTRGVSIDGYRRYLAWQVAWSEYLKSRLTESALRAYFEQHRDRYGGREYRVSQIFLHTSEGGNDAAHNAANHSNTVERLKIVVEKLRVADNIPDAFAQRAREISDSVSADRGGEVGWVSRDGDLPREVMSALRESSYSSETDSPILGPIQSMLGYHLVLVNETRIGEASWETLTDQSQLRQDFAEALFANLVTRQKDARVQYLDGEVRPDS